MLFYAYKNKLEAKSKEYYRKYGFIPEFKAGMHFGKVTIAEVGVIKKEIAYHGDTINTTARIQSLCNEFKEKLLVSEILIENIVLPKGFERKTFDNTVLTGKLNSINLLSINYKI